jgi:hypothetical protein
MVSFTISISHLTSVQAAAFVLESRTVWLITSVVHETSNVIGGVIVLR